MECHVLLKPSESVEVIGEKKEGNIHGVKN